MGFIRNIYEAIYNNLIAGGAYLSIIKGAITTLVLFFAAIAIGFVLGSLLTFLQMQKNKFLNQVSDYSYSLSHKTIEDNRLTEEDFNNVKTLYDNCKTLNMTLATLETDMVNGSLSWEELTKKADNTELAQEVANLSQDNFGNIEKNLQDYEGLIYEKKILIQSKRLPKGHMLQWSKSIKECSYGEEKEIWMPCFGGGGGRGRHGVLQKTGRNFLACRVRRLGDGGKLCHRPGD